MFINVYLADISPLLNNSEIFDKVYSVLPEYRRAKIDRFRFFNDKCLSAAVGYLLKTAVLGLGYSGIDENIITNSHGKPFFSDCQSLYFNLSHSENYAMCVLSDTAIGCDIQFTDRKTEYPIKKILTASEFEEAEASPDKISTFFELWSVKESFLKCIGTGFSVPQEQFAVSLQNGITQSVSESTFSVFKIDAPQSYKCFCVAENYSGDAPKTEFISLNL